MKTTTEQTKEPITNVSEIDIEEELKNGTIEKIEPVSETVEEAADRLGYNNDEIQPYFKEGFIACADWNKELIRELLEALVMANNLAKATYGKEFKEWVESPILESAITKAEQYLNK